MEITLLQQKIHDIRGHKVMLDFDLAILYEVETRSLKQAVKRNISRFPNDFMFELTKEEWAEVITICDNLPPGIKYSPSTPFAFTEHGVTMLASVLRSPQAVQMNISIVRAFIALRELAMNYKELAETIRNLEARYNRQFADIYEALKILLGEKRRLGDFDKRERIGYKTSKG